MTERAPKSDSKAAREARLAEALRANLRRRKEQQRERRRSAEGPIDPDDADPDGKPTADER